MNPGISADADAAELALVRLLGYFLKRKLTNKTAMTKAAAMAVVPWAFIESPHRLSSSLSKTQFSLQKNLKSESFLSGAFDRVLKFQILSTHAENA
jgi:hypothetical protein